MIIKRRKTRYKKIGKIVSGSSSLFHWSFCLFPMPMPHCLRNIVVSILLFFFFHFLSYSHSSWASPGGSVVKNPPANAGNAGLIPGLERSPGEGNGNPLQYSCLGNRQRSLAAYSPWGHKRVRHLFSD